MRVLATANRGASAARNADVCMARGELVGFLDSDDQWAPRAFATVENVLARRADLVFVCLEGGVLPLNGVDPILRVERTKASGWSHTGFAMAPLTKEWIRFNGEQRDTDMLRGDFSPAAVHGDLLSLNGLFVRREAIARAGRFNERFRYYNDWEFKVRLCLQGHGAALDYDGYHRDAGRPDQISLGHALEGLPRRHLYILHSLPRRFPDCVVRYADVLRDAPVDAQYQMDAALAAGRRRSRARP